MDFHLKKPFGLFVCLLLLLLVFVVAVVIVIVCLLGFFYEIQQLKKKEIHNDIHGNYKLYKATKKKNQKTNKKQINK